ncbi:MAG: hypothetical protein U9N35_09060 [Euryarchaeota archaeon]|nr:hypothetical protein [Euryarchaeota archaeon]
MDEKRIKYAQLLGRKGFYEILHYIKNHEERVILSDLLPIAGHGTIMDRREELLEIGLISDGKIKEGRRNYIIYNLTPKGEKVLEKLDKVLDVMVK